MNDQQYLQYCRDLLAEFSASFARRSEHLPEDDPLRELADAFSRLCATPEELYSQGPALVSRLFTTYPELAPLLPRQLLWFFGGDCLHFMADDEIDQFQALEEMRLQADAAGEPFDYQAARAKLLNLQ